MGVDTYVSVRMQLFDWKYNLSESATKCQSNHLGVVGKVGEMKWILSSHFIDISSVKKRLYVKKI